MPLMMTKPCAMCRVILSTLTEVLDMIDVTAPVTHADVHFTCPGFT